MKKRVQGSAVPGCPRSLSYLWWPQTQAAWSEHQYFLLYKMLSKQCPWKTLQKAPDGHQQGWSYQMNATLLNPILIGTALIRKPEEPEAVCKRLCVLRSVVSHFSKYYRQKRKHVKEYTQLSRPPIPFQKGLTPVPCYQTRAASEKSHWLWIQTKRQVPSCHPPIPTGLCECQDVFRDIFKT